MKFDVLENENLDEIKERFIEILSENTQPWWAEALDVSQGVISSAWLKGKLPRIETLFKIIKIKGISPNWLFLGIKPIYIKDLDEIAKDDSADQSRETYLKMLQTESENRDLRQRIAILENSLRIQDLSKLVKIVPSDEKIVENELFKNHGLALVTLMRMLNDIMFKSFELLLNNQIDDKGFEKILCWINNNFDSSQFKAIADLKSLDSAMPPTK